MNKKGWLRIIEVFLAIMIMMGAVLIIMSRKSPVAEIDTDVYERQRQILEIINKNNTLRSEIIMTPKLNNNPLINDFIDKMIPLSWDYSTKICDLNEVCSNPTNIHYNNVYATEVLVTSNLTDYNPKKLRFFVWMKN